MHKSWSMFLLFDIVQPHTPSLLSHGLVHTRFCIRSRSPWADTELWRVGCADGLVVELCTLYSLLRLLRYLLRETTHLRHSINKLRR
ncbi:hypothetical protein BDQ17DRAFT_508571 [Cyathus striatus]|nr:hypothetical protein BDQ17DRAFT_508571 [Cyathus striatus]